MTHNAERPMIAVRGLEKSFGSHQILRDVSFEVKPSQTVAMIGRSGSGKSTMLRCLNMLEEWSGGEIEIDGAPLGYTRTESGKLERWPAKRQAKARENIGMVFQQFNLFPHMTAIENVMVGPRTVKKQPKEQCEQIAADLLAKVGLSDHMSKYPAHLSGGQQQRVAIARTLAMNPKILLLDEITSALDPELVGEVLDVIKKLREEGLTMVLVTHEIQFAHDVADQVIFLDKGKILVSGSPEEVLDNAKDETLVRYLERFTASRNFAPV